MRRLFAINAETKMLATCAFSLIVTTAALRNVPPAAPRPTEQQRTDNAIAELVLGDMTTRDGDELGFSFTSERPRLVYFLQAPPDLVGDVIRPLLDHDTGEIEDPRRAEILQAIRQLEARHAAGEGLTTYRPRHRNLRLVPPIQTDAPTVYSDWYFQCRLRYIRFSLSKTGEKIDAVWSWLSRPFTKPYQADFPVELTAPGYSNDQNMAVVWVYCPEFHPTLGTYVLERDGKSWRIVLAKFLTYL